MVFPPGSLINFTFSFEFQDQEKWVAATCHKKLLQGLHRDIGRKVLSGVDLNSGKIPAELPVSFSVEADSNKWIMSNLEAKTTVHVWKWRIHHRSVVI